MKIDFEMKLKIDFEMKMKIKKSHLKKNMSFLKITDPKKRDLIVEEYLKTKRNIQIEQTAERLGQQDALKELTKHFKPVIDIQKELTQNIIGEVKPIKEGFRIYP